MSLIKIPLRKRKRIEDGIDREKLESLAMEVPPYEYEDDGVVEFWIRPESIFSIKEDKEDGGSLIDTGDVQLYESPLEPHEIADLINGTNTVKV